MQQSKPWKMLRHVTRQWHAHRESKTESAYSIQRVGAAQNNCRPFLNSFFSSAPFSRGNSVDMTVWIHWWNVFPFSDLPRKLGPKNLHLQAAFISSIASYWFSNLCHGQASTTKNEQQTKRVRTTANMKRQKKKKKQWQEYVDARQASARELHLYMGSLKPFVPLLSEILLRNCLRQRNDKRVKHGETSHKWFSLPNIRAASLSQLKYIRRVCKGQSC